MKKLLLMCLILFIGTVYNAQITLGSGTNTGVAPISTYYGYSYVQQIFPKSEINANAAGNITGLKFYLSSSSTLTNSDEWIVYLGHTTNSTFSSTSAWIPLTNLTQVFSGTVTNNAGVVEITFTTPFAYNNIDNLVIAAEENKADYDSNGFSEAMYVYSGAANGSLYYRDDSVNPDPATPPAGTRSANKSVVTIVGLTASTVPACPVVTAPAANATGVSELPTITWNAVSNATGYRIKVGTTPGGSDVLNSVDVGNVTTYTFSTPLAYNKQHYYTVTSYNGANPSVGCSENTFTTKNIPCPTVTAPTANAAGLSTTPTITWDAVNGATGYRLSVGTTPGGTNILNNIDLGNAASYTFTAPLANSTKYYYTVNSYNTLNVSSSCVQRVFATACLPFTSLPWSENFDAMPNIGTEVLPVCWLTSGSHTTQNAASQTYNNPRSAPNYVTIYYPTTAADLWTPGFTLTAGQSYDFSFYWAGDDTSGWQGDVYVNSAQSSTGATQLGSSFVIPATTTTPAYTQYKVTYVPATTGTYYFGIETLATSFAPYYMGFDDFKLELTPSCAEPSNLSVSGNNLSWVAPATAPANGYQYYYSTTNTPPTTGTPTTATTVSVGTLSPETTYYFWVRSMCAAGESTWASYSFTTPPTTPANDACTSAINGSPTATTPYTNTQNALAATNNSGFVSCGTSGMNDGVWYTILGDGTTMTVTLSNVTGWDPEIGVYTGSCGSFNCVGSVDDNGDDTGETISFVAVQGTTYYINVGQYSGFTDNPEGPFTISMSTNGILGTSDLISDVRTVKIYPNPFHDVLYITEVKDVTSVIITDISGRTVKTIAKPTAELQLGGLTAGMYLVTLKYKDGSVKTMKAIKK
ncbi:T9SS type A sorting domain-containing protein [Chryseobacterium sp.]|uniref:T9SS type A sorting domain-containing protein n=1 Tax=Chryseobacterium sp. TaxID=1871047 RepID=UPI0011CB5C17|nr:T9SS type A sorting domain-containing protein [Chryseobacterium sp.]TXF77639.1 T9SS type A sorting domain-containing protein [Chryseobacterium sp.]